MSGGLVALRLKSWLPVAIGFSAGAVIGVAFFDLAPEALEAGRSFFAPRLLMMAVALGFFFYMVLERMVARHDCEGQARAARGMLGAASFSFHSVLDGFAMGIAFQAGRDIGLIVAAAVLSHDFADGLNTVTVVTQNGGSRDFALRWLTVDAVAPCWAHRSACWFIPAMAPWRCCWLCSVVSFFISAPAIFCGTAIAPSPARPRPWQSSLGLRFPMPRRRW